jgi:hypothetical protein
MAAVHLWGPLGFVAIFYATTVFTGFKVAPSLTAPGLVATTFLAASGLALIFITFVVEGFAKVTLAAFYGFFLSSFLSDSLSNSAKDAGSLI